MSEQTNKKTNKKKNEITKYIIQAKITEIKQEESKFSLKLEATDDFSVQIPSKDKKERFNVLVNNKEVKDNNNNAKNDKDDQNNDNSQNYYEAKLVKINKQYTFNSSNDYSQLLLHIFTNQLIAQYEIDDHHHIKSITLLQGETK